MNSDNSENYIKTSSSCALDTSDTFSSNTQYVYIVFRKMKGQCDRMMFVFNKEKDASDFISIQNDFDYFYVKMVIQ